MKRHTCSSECLSILCVLNYRAVYEVCASSFAPRYLKPHVFYFIHFFLLDLYITVNIFVVIYCLWIKTRTRYVLHPIFYNMYVKMICLFFFATTLYSKYYLLLTNVTCFCSNILDFNCFILGQMRKTPVATNTAEWKMKIFKIKNVLPG